MSSGFSPYTYRPLRTDIGELRLVRFRSPDAIKFDFEIVHFPLSAAPSYTALSYTWGQSDREKRIPIQGAPLGVTKNLNSFLRNARARLRNGRADGWDGGWLWIDAISINQDDLAERSAQVAMMKAIYERARGVIIWLGDAGKNSDSGIDLMRRFAPLAGEDAGRLMHRELDEGLFRFGSEDRYIEFSSDDWEAMGKVLNRSYWRRAWIVQEATTSAGNEPDIFSNPQPIQVWCGSKTIPFETVIAANHGAFLVRQRSDLRKILNHEISALDLHARRRRQQGHCGRLLDLLMRMRFFKATDPRDKVYAILPLVSRHDHIAKDLKPDYTQSVEDVYTNLAAAVIEGENGLHILGTAGMRRRVAVPSWVPDCSFFSGSAFGRVELRQANSSSSSIVPVFKASGITKTDVTVDASNKRKLRVKGVIIDTVSKTSMARPTYPIKDAEVSPMWRALAGPDEESYKGICTRKEAFETILTADFKLFSSVALEGERGHRIDTQQRTNIFEPYDMSINQATYYRMLFTTERGYLGLASHTARVGDQVCIFFGHAFPVILRQKESHWLFNGEAYIHGLMDGEAVQKLDLDAISQIFEVW